MQDQRMDSRHMSAPGWRQLQTEQHAPARLFQISLMSALLDGIYEGEMTFGELETFGDFGLGTFNDLDGEMVAHEGSFYQLRSDGSARGVTPDEKTPFAVVTFFQPQRELKVVRSMDKATLLLELEQATEANLFTAIQITGEFATLTTRTVARQVQPFPPLTTAAEHEDVKVFNDVRGTLIGFRAPAFAQGIGVAGFHLHFLREDKQAGGHVLDFAIRDVAVQIAELHNLTIQLPSSAAFLQAKLAGPSVNDAIKASEG